MEPAQKHLMAEERIRKQIDGKYYACWKEKTSMDFFKFAIWAVFLSAYFVTGLGIFDVQNGNEENSSLEVADISIT